ncbi:MAG: DUF1080 domain-containing protein [Leeuwenhoekiella sp.]
MRITLATFAVMALTLVGCKENKPANTKASSEISATGDTASMGSGQKDWTALFDGKDLNGWHAYNGEEPTQWRVEDETLIFTPAENRKGSENLVTDATYTDFELSLDYKISEGGNSGVMWAVEENEAYHEPYITGPEVQILDNERHPDAKAGKSHQSGALYDMIPPSSEVAKPAGEWNSMTFVVNHKTNTGSIDLNGTRVVDFPVKGEEWKSLVKKSKFADWEHFAQTESGHIALQDHGHEVAFKNIKIKEL